MKSTNYSIDSKGDYKCKHCKKVLKSGNSHSTLSAHVNTHKVQVKSRSIQELFKAPSRGLQELIVNFLVAGHHAYTTVEQHWFRELVHFLNKDITVPNATTVKRWLGERYDILLLKVQRRLKGVSRKVALTTDLWTSSSKKPFMAITAHYLGPSRVLESILLDFCYLPYPHTGVVIKNKLLEVMIRFSLSGKVTAITTDNAESNIVAMRELPEGPFKVSHVRCVAHVIHLCVTDGLLTLRPQLKKIRNLMIFLKNSPKQEEKLRLQTVTLGLDFLRPLRDVKTRWNSTYEMIRRALIMRPVLQYLVNHDKDFEDHIIDEADWLLMRGLEDVLKPYADATTRLSGYLYPSICLVVNTVDWLCRHLDTCRGTFEGSLLEVSEAIRIKLDKYEPLLKTDQAQLATLLDQRSKLAHFIKYNYDTDLVKKILVNHFDTYRAAITEGTSEAPPEIADDIFPEESESTSEIATYLAWPLENKKVDPVVWWHSRQSSLPVLSRLALDILVVPATSVASEQAFSKSGDLITKKRNRLSYKTIQQDMSLHSWINLEF